MASIIVVSRALLSSLSTQNYDPEIPGRVVWYTKAAMCSETQVVEIEQQKVWTVGQHDKNREQQTEDATDMSSHHIADETYSCSIRSVQLCARTG